MLSVGSASHAVQTARVMERIEPVIERDRARSGSRSGGCEFDPRRRARRIQARHPRRPHRGRTAPFDRSMPEEINRVLTDQISDLLFIHSPEARDNLVSEGVSADRVHAVGNTMIDTLVAMRPRITEIRRRSAAARTRAPISWSRCTGRRWSTGRCSPPRWASGRGRRRHAGRVPDPSAHGGLDGSSGAVLHVAPRARGRPARIRRVPQLGAGLGRGAHRLGGMQEETTYLGVPCFTLRDNTERPITCEVGTNVLLGLAPGAHQGGPRTDRAGTIAAGRGTTWLGRRRCRTSRRRSARDRARRRCGAGGRRLAPRRVGAPVVTRPATSDNPRLAAQAGRPPTRSWPRRRAGLGVARTHTTVCFSVAVLDDRRAPSATGHRPGTRSGPGGHPARVPAHASADRQVAGRVRVGGMRLARDGRPAVAGLGLGALECLTLIAPPGPWHGGIRSMFRRAGASTRRAARMWSSRHLRCRVYWRVRRSDQSGPQFRARAGRRSVGSRRAVGRVRRLLRLPPERRGEHPQRESAWCAVRASRAR